VSPQLSYLESISRIEMTNITDDEALSAISTLMKSE
jgi:tryptophan synthase beta subunit